jgi:hypothetical protein
MTCVVTRTDTGATIGRTATHDDTGIYTFTITDPTDAFDLTYNFTIGVSYGGESYTQIYVAHGPPSTTVSGMGMTWDDIYNEVAFYRYQTRSPTAAQIVTAKAEALVGCGKFFSAREWSFLQPASTLAVAASATATDLPANYRSNSYNFHFDTTMYNLRRIGIGELLAMRTAGASTTGPVAYYAIRPKTFVAATGQRFEVLFYPIPSEALTLACQFTLNPSAPSNDSDYLPGGPLHDQSILYAALAYCESIAGKSQGPMALQYAQELKNSIARDAEVDITNLGESTCGQRPSAYDMAMEGYRNASDDYEA